MKQYVEDHIFFWKTNLIPFGSFYCAKLKILKVDLELQCCTIFGLKMVHLPKTLFLEKPLISCTSWPISLYNRSGNSLEWIEYYEDALFFLTQNNPFAPNENFFRKTTNIIFIYLLTPFTMLKFKKILRADPELWGCTSFRTKINHFPQMRIFSEKPSL